MAKPNTGVFVTKTGELVEFTQEDLEEYTECVKSKCSSFSPILVGASTVIALSTPIKNPSNMFLKRTGIGMFCYIIGEVYRKVYASSLCWPAIEKLIQFKLENNRDSKQNVDNPSNESTGPITLDTIPLTTGDLDLSPPSSFSLDLGYEEKDTRMVTETKPLTYEELRMKSREEYKTSYRPYSSKLKSQMDVPVKTEHGDEQWDSGSSKWPRKTNIYGDVLE